MANILNLIFKADTKEVKDAAKDFDGLKDKVKDLSKEIPGLGSVINKLGSEIGVATEAISGLAAGIAGVAVGTAAAVVALGALGMAMAFKFAEKIDGFGDLGEKMGITADQAYYLSEAAKQAGGSLEGVMGMVNKLNKAMANSGEEMKGAGAAFQRLGVETKNANGLLKDNSEVLDELSKKWEESIKTASDYADMQQVLGKNFEEQLAVRKKVIEAQEISQQMYEQGIGITKQALEATDEQEKSQLRLGGAFNAMGSIMIEQVIPAFTALTNWFTKSYTEGGLVAKVFVAIAVATEVLMLVVKGLTTTFMVLVETISVLGDVQQIVFKAMWQGLTGNVSGAVETITNGFDRIKNRVISVGESIKETWKGTLDNSNIKRLLESGGDVMSVINRKSDITAPRKDPLNKGAAGGQTRPDTGKEEDPNKAIESLIASLQKQLLAQENLNKADQVAIMLQDEKYKGASKENKEKAVTIAHQLDELSTRKLLNETLKDTNKITSDYAEKLRQEVSARTKNKYQIMEENEVYKINQKTLEAIQKLKDKGIKGGDLIKAETELWNQNAEAQRKVKEATEERKRADEDWVTRGVDQYVKGLGTINDALANLAESGLKGVEDGFVKLFTTGEFGFKDFVRSILEQLLRLIVQFTIIKPIIESFKASMAASSGGGGWGAVGTFVASLFSAHGNAFTSHHAKGDVVSSPTNFSYNGGMGQMGEAGDEGILPLKRNAAGDLGVVSAGGGGKGMTMVNNITINSSGDNSKPEDQQKLARTIVNMIDQRFSENMSKANRSGGINNRVSMQIG